MSYKMWQDTPPTYDQWIKADSEGYWWIKMTIPSFEEDSLVFPEVHLYEAVRIFFEPDLDAGLLSRKGRLVFDRQKEKVYCDNLPEGYDTVKWQPVLPHSDNQNMGE